MDKTYISLRFIGTMNTCRTHNIRESYTMNYLSTAFALEWLAHNSINIQVIDDIDQLLSVITKEYDLYITSDHANNFNISALQSIKDFLVEQDK